MSGTAVCFVTFAHKVSRCCGRPRRRDALCMVLARAGALIHRDWLEAAPASGLHCRWRSPCGTLWRIFNAYVPPRAGEAAAYAIARTCVVEALRSLDLPALVLGNFSAELGEHPLSPALGTHG